MRRGPGQPHTRDLVEQRGDGSGPHGGKEQCQWRPLQSGLEQNCSNPDWIEVIADEPAGTLGDIVESHADGPWWAV